METVISCTKVRDWTKDGKSVPIYSVALSDGQGGESFGKEIPVGTPMSELVLEQSSYGLKIKWNKPGTSGGGFGGGRQRSGNESFALAYAKDYAVAKVANGKEFKGEDILKLADLFYGWLEKKKAVTQSAPVVLASTLPNKPSGISEHSTNDDLPF